jgi:glycosyltransferase involved in cell wall biosynthesis
MGKYILHLVRGLLRADECNEYVIYGDSRVFAAEHWTARVKFRNPGRVPYPLWEQAMLPVWIRQDRLDLLHCPVNTAPVAMPKGVRLIVTIHDVMFLLPDSLLEASRVLRQRLGNFYRKTVALLTAGRAERVITVSEFSKREIAEHLGIPSNRIRVVHEGVDAEFDSMVERATLTRELGCDDLFDSPFVFVLGSGDPRKNTLGVIRAYASIYRDLPEKEKLVIAGLRDWRSSRAYKLAREMGIETKVRFASYVSEATLVWLYRNARCFVYPSKYEGFGFPVLEAMACGTPVITSNCTSIPEIAGDAAILVDPRSSESISGALVRLLQDEVLRSELIRKGRERVLNFGWENTVQNTLAVYESVL